MCGVQFLQRSKPYLGPPGSLERLNVVPRLFPSQLEQFLRKPSAVCGPHHSPSPPAWHPFLTQCDQPPSLWFVLTEQHQRSHSAALEESPFCTDAQITATNHSRALATSCFTAHLSAPLRPLPAQQQAQVSLFIRTHHSLTTHLQVSLLD